MTRLLALICIASSIGILAYVIYTRHSQPLIFSESQMLDALWRSYKAEYLEPGTLRTIDRQRDDITTSEGQSYTMLRAVWMGDKEVFDASWQWTKDNLWRDDRLFAWLFGERSDGTFGIIEDDEGETSASDADADIALALIFAFARWQDDDYLYDAHSILTAIWDQNVIDIDGTPYLLANDKEKALDKLQVLVNPSYLAPYAYRIFAQVDTEHEWNALVDSSYDLIDRSITEDLDGASSGLPPDWLLIDVETGELSRAPAPLEPRYGYDAIRTPWRLALDAIWFRDARAEEILRKMTPLSRAWDEGFIPAVFARDGSILEGQETPAMYGTAIGHFLITDPARAREIYEEKLLPLYDQDTSDWRTRLSYYDDNWAWFGMALYSRSLPNLALTPCPLLLTEPGSCMALRVASTTQTL